MPGEKVTMERAATLSACGRYRYALRRRWGAGPLATWVLLNPSTADAAHDDPTVRRCVAFARRWGFAAIDVVNLFGLRSSDPAVLVRHRDPGGPGNDAAVRAAVRAAAVTVVAWGNRGGLAGRDAVVLAQLGADVVCLGLTRDGRPRHPLYVPAATRPLPLRDAVAAHHAVPAGIHRLRGELSG